MMRRDDGFTIIELLLAMTFFSFVLIFVSAGFVQINRSFTHGFTVKRVHQTGRTVLEGIVRSIRLGEGSNVVVCPSADPGCGGTTRNRLCVAGIRYGWNLGDPSTTPGAEVLNGGGLFTLASTKDGAPCSADLVAAQSTELLTTGIFVRQLNVTPIFSNSGYQVNLVLSTDPAEATEVAPGEFECNFLSGPNSAFCDVVQLSTTVTTRN